MKSFLVLFSLLVISSLVVYGQSNLVPLTIVLNGKGSVTSLPHYRGSSSELCNNIAIIHDSYSSHLKFLA